MGWLSFGNALDIFFVLSGFFISEILIDQFGDGTLRFREFYLSRTRRLAPTALTVIAVSVILGHLLYTSAKAAEIDIQAFWTAVFGSNWYFSSTGDNYFANISGSPLIHYWSLSVEEQFYLVWPLLIWVALRNVRNRGWNLHRTMFTVFGVMTVVSFSYSLWHSAAAPIAAYYSTFDRVWEFGIGGLLAVGRPWLTKIPAHMGTILSWVMVVALAASIFILHYGQAFPAPWGLLPVLPCAGLIAAGISGRATGPFLITNVPMVYLGTISYSFYLWHLPVNFFLRSYFIEDTALYKFVALTLGFVVSVLSYHLLERPMRRATWLMTRRERRRARSKPPIDLRPVKLGWLAVVAVVASSLAVFSLASSRSSPDPELTTYKGASPSPTKTAPETPETPEQQQAVRVVAALGQSSFPDFDPPLGQLKNLFRDIAASGCVDVTIAQIDQCRFGSRAATKRAMVLGDSTAIGFMAGIRPALDPKIWSIQQFTRGGCPTWTLRPSKQLNTVLPGCVEHQRQALDLVRSQRPDLLILITDAQSAVGKARDVNYSLQGAELVRSTLSPTLAAMKPLAKRVVVLEVNPGLKNLQDCVTRFSKPDDCESTPSKNWYTGTSAERSTAERYGVQYISTLRWFCDGRCPAFMDRTPVSSDGGHLTIQFARSLAPLLRDALLGSATK